MTYYTHPKTTSPYWSHVTEYPSDLVASPYSHLNMPPLNSIPKNITSLKSPYTTSQANIPQNHVMPSGNTFEKMQHFFSKSATKLEKVLQKVLHLKPCIYKGLLAIKRPFVALVTLLFKSIIREKYKKPIFLLYPLQFLYIIQT